MSLPEIETLDSSQGPDKTAEYDRLGESFGLKRLEEMLFRAVVFGFPVALWSPDPSSPA